MILVPGTCLLIAMSLLLVLCVSGMAGSGRHQTINGKVPDAPQLEATGLALERVPWLGSTREAPTHGRSPC